MALQAPDVAAAAAAAAAPPAAEFSLLQLIGINLPALNYGLVCASVGVLVLPQEAQRMFAEQRSLYLAVMLALTGISQLVCPMIGYASDRTRMRMGRRMPYILFGDAAALVSLGMLYLARTELWGSAYLVSILAAILSLNIAYTGFTGLVSDIVPESQLGFASGVMGGLTALGAVGGLLGVGFFLPLSSAYPLYGGAILISMPLVWLAAHEHDVELTADKCQPWALSDLRSSYWISPGTHGDFFWVFVSRTFYYMAVSVQIYILYYLRDMIGAHQAWVREDAVMYTTVLCVVAQGSAGIVAANAGGWLSDVCGRKPLIYMACTVMASVYIGYIFVESYYAVVVLGLIYGASNGVYLAVDYALAVECLPNPEDHAKDLALWGIAAFLGACLGPAFTGPLLTIIGAGATGATIEAVEDAEAAAAAAGSAGGGEDDGGGGGGAQLVALEVEEQGQGQLEAAAMGSSAAGTGASAGVANGGSSELELELEPGGNVHYRTEGYVAVMLVGVVYSFLCGVFVMKVKRGNATAAAAAAAAAATTPGGPAAEAAAVGSSLQPSSGGGGGGKHVHVPIDSEDPDADADADADAEDDRLLDQSSEDSSSATGYRASA